MTDPVGTAPYNDHARQRWVNEPPKRSGRTEFARDRARVLHSAALRRLSAKTQVVGPGESDFPRTRLTHTLECAQIGRELGQAIGCDPDLVEVACLAHDLGHPPFGHNGEQALDEIAQQCGGFEGNAQTLRLLTRLEAKTFDDNGRSAGLNLTRAALEAATKYPWTRAEEQRKFGVYADDAEVFVWMREGAPEGRKPLEAQVMDWADDVAYSVHDLEDALHAGHLNLAQLRNASERAELAALSVERYVPAAAEEEVDAALDRLLGQVWWPTVYDGTLRSLAGLKNLTSQLIGRFCREAEQATHDKYGDQPLARYDADLVVPYETRLECAVLKAVTARYVMDQEAAQRRYAEQRDLVRELAAVLVARAPETLDPMWRPMYAEAPDEPARLRVVVDQIASLTDTSAVALHRRLVAG